VLEDILGTHQRPKVEIFDDYIFAILKMISYNHDEDEIHVEQLSLILGKNFVITFQEVPGDIFDPLRARIEGGKGRARKSGSDYLAYAIMDIVVDRYFLVLEKLGEEIEELEEAVLEDYDSSIVETIHILKRQLIDLRKMIWPLREVISNLQRDESPLIKKATSRFITDLYDHIIQTIDTLETYREMVSSLLDIYLTMVSNRMNEVMKVLTIIATIFIPLSFLAGVYGMNFDTGISQFNMPELEFPYGYMMFWGLAVLIAGGLLTYFRKKRWL
jgi:magnesium transporter